MAMVGVARCPDDLANFFNSVLEDDYEINKVVAVDEDDRDNTILGHVSDDYITARMALAKQMARTRQALVVREINLSKLHLEEPFFIPTETQENLNKLNGILDNLSSDYGEGIIELAKAIFDPIYDRYYMEADIWFTNKSDHAGIIVPISKDMNSLLFLSDGKECSKVSIDDKTIIEMMIMAEFDKRDNKLDDSSETIHYLNNKADRVSIEEV